MKIITIHFATTFLIIFSLIFWRGAGGEAFCQSPNYLWAKSSGGNANDVGSCCTYDASGNIIVAGYFRSPTITFGSTVLTNADNTGNGDDYFIVKYDPSGNVLWAKSAGDTGGEDGFGCVTDASENIIATGYFTSTTITFGTTVLTNAGGGDIFIVKYDSSGSVLWAKSAGGTGNEVSWSCATDADGNIIATGHFTSHTITFGTTVLTNGTFGNDIFIVKYDPNGNVMWAKSVNGTGDDLGRCCSTDANGNIFATGRFNSPTLTFGTTVLTFSGGGYDMFIVKYDSSGNVLWANSAVGTFQDEGNSCSIDASGNIYATGYFASPTITFGTIMITNPNNTGGHCDMFIVKYDSSGNVLWVKYAGGPGYDFGKSCSADANGNIIATGFFGSSTITFGTTVLTNTGGTGMFIVKYDSSGNVLWAKSFGGSVYDESWSCSTDAAGNIIATGYFLGSSITFGTTVLTNAGGNDMFIVKLDTTIVTGIEEIDNNNSSVLLFPNPANSEVTLDFDKEENHEVQLYTALGEMLFNKTIRATQMKIGVKYFPHGIYYVKFRDGEMKYSRKLVIE